LRRRPLESDRSAALAPASSNALRVALTFSRRLRDTAAMSTTGAASPLIRAATPSDGPAFIAMVRELAAFESLPPPDEAAATRLIEHAFGHRPRFELCVVELAGALVAYAVYFETYSTFVARPTLYLEDLFVRAEARGRGIGKLLLVQLAGLALERGCGRFEWSVLDWNENARRFYRGLGARILEEWQLCRLDADALVALARPGAPTG
jgi:GNAT superfamily N-acetyltransferase